MIEAKNRVFAKGKKGQPASSQERLVLHEQSKARLVHGILIGIVVITVAVIVLIIVGELTKPCDPGEKKSVACTTADTVNKFATAIKDAVETIGHYFWAIFAVAGVYVLTAAAKVIADIRGRTAGGGDEPEPEPPAPPDPGPEGPDDPGPEGPDDPEPPEVGEEDPLVRRTAPERAKSAHNYSARLRMLSRSGAACDTWMGL